MSRWVRVLLAAALVAVLTPSLGLAQGALAPSPPGTGPLSVQMFIGGTQYAYLSVFPPAAYTDGSAIPVGTPVQVKVYRWSRGAGWTDVELPAGDGPWGSGGQGVAGQSFINMVAITPVDCAPPRVVVLGVTAVVGGVESPVINTANLTFRYAAEPPADNPSECVPLLVRYATPGEALAADQAPPANSAPPGAAAPPAPVSTEPEPVGLPTAVEPPPAVAPSGSPRIDGVKPTVGAVTSAELAVTGVLRNMQVSVLGANFDPINPDTNRVTIGGVEATILGIQSNEIRIEVPAGAASGPVQVTVGDQASNEVEFVVTAAYANAVVSEDVRFGREWLPDLLQAALGAPDHDGPAGLGTPGTGIGIGTGGSLTLDLGEGQEVYDGPGNDLVVFERGGGADQSLANEGYEVLVSDAPDSGFVSLGSAYGVDRGVGDGFDLSRGGVASARYVRIVDDGDGTTVNGADIDAVEVVAVSAPPTEPAAAGALDLIFVIDLTESMSDDIANVKETAVEILNTMAAAFPDHRVAILGYRDWEDAVMFEDYPFSSDQADIVANIEALTVTGGGDWPEAVLEALLRAIDCTSLGGWRSGVEKHIILMGDAPPHDPIPQGPDAGKTTDDVDWAAKRADPVIIHSIVIRFDEATRVAFERLAAGSGGSTALAERAEDVPGAILGTIGAIAGTPAATTEPVETVTAEVEKNDSFGTANPVTASGTITGTIDPARDSDWYGLAVPAGGELRVTITQVAPELDLVYRVWNANLDTISDWVRPLALGGDTEGFVDLPSGGRYVLEVRDGADDAASSQAYLITTVFTTMVDTGEPNASVGTATPLALGTTVRANILPRRDHDFYRLEVPGRSELHVMLDEVSADLDLVFRIWNAERDTISDWYAPLRAGAPTEGYFDFPAAGIYYLEVADNGDDQRSPQPYALTTELVPVVDAAEGNDSFGRADRITIGQPVQGTILPRRDHDWYRVEIPGRAELHVLISNVAPELDMVFRVWDADRRTVTDWYAPLRAGADNEAYVDFAAAGTYCLEVADSGDDQRSTQPYLLETSISVTADALLANDDFGRTEPIQLGQLVTGAILPVRDHDWYSIVVPMQGQMQVDITNVPPNLEVVFRVWNAEKRTITDWQAPLRAGADTVGLAEIAVSGTYYIEVSDSRDDARSPLPYTLQATMGGS